jgi:FkbM family methyltransferase
MWFSILFFVFLAAIIIAITAQEEEEVSSQFALNAERLHKFAIYNAGEKLILNVLMPGNLQKQIKVFCEENDLEKDCYRIFKHFNNHLRNNLNETGRGCVMGINAGIFYPYSDPKPKVVEFLTEPPMHILLSQDWPSDDRMSNFIMRNRQWGPMDQFTDLMQGQTNAVILDIGGNIGVQALHGAFLGHRVFTFEPFPSILKVLEWNVLNNCVEDRVTIVRAALSNSVGTVGMAYDPQDVGHTIVDSSGGEENLVPTLMLDYFAPVWREKVHLMKIDVEGFECAVLEGAAAFMTSQYAPEFILFECFPAMLTLHGCSAGRLLQMVYDYGYEDMFAYNEFDSDTDFARATQYERDIIPNERITPDMFESYTSFTYREIRAQKKRTAAAASS